MIVVRKGSIDKPRKFSLIRRMPRKILAMQVVEPEFDSLRTHTKRCKETHIYNYNDLLARWETETEEFRKLEGLLACLHTAGKQQRSPISSKTEGEDQQHFGCFLAIICVIRHNYISHTHTHHTEVIFLKKGTFDSLLTIDWLMGRFSKGNGYVFKTWFPPLLRCGC